jgi:hypothetical protein
MRTMAGPIVVVGIGLVAVPGLVANALIGLTAHLARQRNERLTGLGFGDVVGIADLSDPLPRHPHFLADLFEGLALSPSYPDEG